MKRNYPSGHEKRKAQEEKKKRVNTEIEKTLKLDQFFVKTGAKPEGESHKNLVIPVIITQDIILIPISIHQET